jgi:4a-hydroxytetrahydrobiopterin dehydratase
MSELSQKECVPCRGGVPPLPPEEQEALLGHLEAGWELVEQHHLRREFRFANFVEALRFTNAVGELAEEQGHHPDIHLSWGRVVLEIWTHKIDGLTESDFVWAAKAERLPRA